MPPPVGRYGPSGLNGPYAQQLQHAHLQQQQHQHQQQQQQQQSQHHPAAAHAAQSANTALPPPSLGGHPGFATGNPSTNINPFTMSGAGITNGMSVPGFAGAAAAGAGAGAAAAAGAGAGGGTAGDGGGTGLASHAAQMGFARGAQMQQQQLHQAHDGRLALETKTGAVKTRIRDVWKHNLAQEMAVLRHLVEKYPYISMDTEFPGIVARPIGSFTTKADYHYQTLRCNVDLLKMIQLGITLFSPEGEIPPPNATDANGQPYGNSLVPAPCTWQFNFRFSLEDDMYAQDSTAMLAKAGIDFATHDKNGIDPFEFGALLISSGLVLLDDVHWISFHSGYDFGYLMKIMLCNPLPDKEEDFHRLLNIFFPSLYDIKYLMKFVGRNQAISDSPLTPAAVQILTNLGQKSGLQDIADELGVKRVGIAHQAGSDSLVTGEIYWKMRQIVFNGSIDESKYSGQIWGLNGQMPAFTYQFGPHQTPNLNGATIYAGTPSTPHAHTPQHPGVNMGAFTPGGGLMGAFQAAKG